MSRPWFMLLCCSPLFGSFILPLAASLLFSMAVLAFIVIGFTMDVKLLRRVLDAWFNIPDPPGYESWDIPTKIKFLGYKMACLNRAHESPEMQQLMLPMGTLILYLRCKFTGVSFPPPYRHPPFLEDPNANVIEMHPQVEYHA